MNINIFKLFRSNRFILLSIILLLCLGGAVATKRAYGAAMEGVSEEKNISVLREMQSAIPPQERDLDNHTKLTYGPLLYRLATAQGLLFQSTGKPFILRLNPDDGFSDRIGGIPVAPKEYPWQVALLHPSFGNIFCSGSYIGNGWIVTAAHCISDSNNQALKKNDILVLTGSVNLISGGKKVHLEKEPIIHDKWDPVTHANDIALLKVAKIESLPAVRIPTIEVEAPLISINKILTVSGWGLTTENGDISTVLLKVGVPVVSMDSCSTAYPGQINEHQICAGSLGRDSCQGDSGGPLTGRDGKGNVLIGVVSFGKGCGREGYPGVYTRIVAYLDWITQKTGGKV